MAHSRRLSVSVCEVSASQRERDSFTGVYLLEASPLTLTTGDVHNLWLRYAQLLDKTFNLLFYSLLNELGSFTQIALWKVRNEIN